MFNKEKNKIYFQNKNKNRFGNEHIVFLNKKNEFQKRKNKFQKIKDIFF